jgi:hypothetical protein
MEAYGNGNKNKTKHSSGILNITSKWKQAVYSYRW